MRQVHDKGFAALVSLYLTINFIFQAFHDIAYRADSREDLLSAINGFLDDTVVLPPGEWDRNVLLPILIEQSRAMARRRKMAKAGEIVVPLIPLPAFCVCNV